MTKRILAPVLALVGFGLPAWASITVYCDNGCGPNTTAQFDSVVASTPYVYAYGADQIFTGTLIGSTDYLDATGVEFMDNQAGNMFSISGANALQTSGTNGKILISVPAAYAALQLSVSAASGLSNFTCIDSACDGTQLSTTPIFIDYINIGGGAWTIQISASSPESIIVDGFNPAGPQATSDTPEVGTLLLIGSGLIAMRWMRRVRPRVFRNPLTA